MSNRAQLGHNRGGTGRSYAIMFDLDQDMLNRLRHEPEADDAYSDIRQFLSLHGFEWMQGSIYFGDSSINAVSCITTVQKLAQQFDWFSPSLRDIRMLRIEESNDLKRALNLMKGEQPHG